MSLDVILQVDAIQAPLTGVGRYTIELAQGFLNKLPGLQMRFFASGRWIVPDQLIGNITDTHFAQPPRPSFISRLRGRLACQPWVIASYWEIMPRMWALPLRSERGAIIHSPNYWLLPTRGPSVATIHDLSILHNPNWHPPERVAHLMRHLPKTLRQADHLITLSESIRLEILQRFDWPAEKISTTSLGVSPLFHPRTSQEIAPRLADYGLTPGNYCLCVATLEPRKNLDRLLDAYSNLSSLERSHFPLVLVGHRGWNSRLLQDDIARVQCQGWLRYLGHVPDKDLVCLYAGARLFAFPSLYEGFGLPVLEAMASGVPVVTSTCPALVELSGGTALHVDPYDVSKIAEALEQGIEDDSWRLTATQGGLLRAKQLTWENCLSQTLKCYRTIANVNIDI